MEENFSAFNQKVIVVESSGSSRVMITDLLKAIGFKDIQGLPGIKELLGLLEVEPVGWIFTSVYAGQPTNFLQLLKLISRVPALRHTRVSAFVDEGELDSLPTAFEYGLLSYHMKPFTRDGLNSELNYLMDEFKASEWNSTLLSSAYLRKNLTLLGDFEDLLKFERQLMKVLPGNVQQMLNMAIPLIKTDKVDEAMALLAQIKMIDPSAENTITNILNLYMNGVELPTRNSKDATTTTVNFLNIKSVVIVESDSSIQKELTWALHELGVDNIRCFDDGKLALEGLLAQKDNDLIIQEWRIPKLSGPLFLQKAKDEASQTAPFIVYSSLIQSADAPFVREMGVTTVIPKPCTRADLIKQVIWTVQQEHAPTDQPAIERKIRKAIAAKDWNAVETLSSKFLANPAISSGAKDLIQAEVSYGRGKFEDARGFALSSFKNAGDSIFVLNLLGKIMMQLNEPATALKCFQKAQDLAPQNLERLCQIAEIQADLEDHEKSLATQAEVENLDPTSEKLKETKAKIALKSGDEEGAKSIMGSIRAVENVVSYMNNLAVAMARCGQIAEGIEQYRKTIRSLPVDRLDLIAVVEYNLALAFLRSNDFKQALAHLERATSNPNSKIQKKALSLIRRLHSAEAQGIVFSLQTDKETLPLQNTESANKNEVVYNSGGSEKSRVLDDLAAVVENRPGENCCVSIYHATRQPPSVSSMLEGNLKFVSRSTIHKVVLAVGDKI